MKKVIKFIVIGIVALGIIGSFMDSGEKDPAPSTPASTNQSAQNNEAAKPNEVKPKEEPKKAYLVGSGTHKIGVDLPAGEYMIVADGMAYMELAKDSKGTLESIITNDNFGINRYLKVNDGEYLKLIGCKVYPLNAAPKFDKMEMYKVGVDIPAGEYKLTSEGSLGYVEVNKDSRGDLYGIVTNDNFNGSTYITVQNGQYLKLVNAYIAK